MGGQALPYDAVYDATTKSIARPITVFSLCPAKDVGHAQLKLRGIKGVMNTAICLLRNILHNFYSPLVAFFLTPLAPLILRGGF